MIPARSRARALVLMAGTSAIVWACEDNCEKLQDQICLCQGQTTTEQSTCQSNYETQEGNNQPTNEDYARCGDLLTACIALIDGGSGCAQLQTDRGREICGLAPYPDGG